VSDRLAAAWHRKHCKRSEVRDVGDHRSGQMEFIDLFLFISTHISLVLIFAGSVEKTLGEEVET